MSSLFRLCLSLLLVCEAGVAAESVTSKVIGLRVIHPAEDGGPRAFRWKPGTGIALRIDGLPKGTVALSPDSALDFWDDQGLVLGAGDPAAEEQTELRLQEFAHDGQTAVVIVDAPAVPTPEATALTVRGSLAFTSGGVPERVVGDFTLRTGKVLEAGPLRFTLAQVDSEDDEDSDSENVIMFSSTGNLRLLKSLELLGPDGAKIQARYRTNRSGQRAGEPPRHLFEVHKLPQEFRLAVTVLLDTVETQVEIDVVTPVSADSSAL